MSSPRLRRAAAPALLVVALAACGRGAPDASVRAGSPVQDAGGTPSGTSSSTTAAVADPTVDPIATPTSAPAGATTSVPAATSTTVAQGTEGDPSGSIVDGLSPVEVRSAVTAPVGATTRRLAGPTLERLTLPSGATVWRVRIPGRFPVRSARVTVSVGSRTVGTGIVAPDLDALVAITTDGRGLTAGAPVSYRWEGSDAVVVAGLEVAR